MMMAAERQEGAGTQVGDLPEVCLAQVIGLTSPRDASRCAAVSPSFRAAADSDLVWGRFLPRDRGVLLRGDGPPRSSSNKDAYLALCDGGAAVDDGRVWLDRASGARCYALPARRLSLPWDDGQFSWTWTPHPLSSNIKIKDSEESAWFVVRRFGEAAELVECTCLDIYGRLPAAALTPATAYAAYLVYGTAEGHRGLSFPDQETAVAVGGREAARRAVCLRPDDTEARKFGDGLAVAGAVGEPRRRKDGWWEMEMGRVRTAAAGEEEQAEEVVASFEVLGWYPKRGLVVEAIEFRPAPPAT